MLRISKKEGLLDAEFPEVPEGAWVFVSRGGNWPQQPRFHEEFTLNDLADFPNGESAEAYGRPGRDNATGVWLQPLVVKGTEDPGGHGTLLGFWSTAPFAVVFSQSTSRNQCVVDRSQLVKNGRLDRKFGPKPYTVRETSGTSESRRGWCRIATIANMAGMTPTDLWDAFRAIWHSSRMWCPATNDETAVARNHMAPEGFGDSGASPHVELWNDGRPALVPSIPGVHIWVPASWAHSVLALRELKVPRVDYPPAFDL